MTWNAAVIVTAHNAAGTIAMPLRALARQVLATDSRLRVVVVDDRSTDETARRAQEHLPDGVRVLRVVDLPPYGASARQAALDIACRDAVSAVPPADALLVLDADAEVPPGWVEHMRVALGDADLVSWPLSYDPADGSWRARVLAMLQSADVAFYLLACRALSACGLSAGTCFG
ncbi:MAG: glycosyltransferase family 2 protein, partial [Cytophagaceae bacterium]|nr:glycosyltransferase family 2 protein [Gemmatimonadaceae bacterium]